MQFVKLMVAGISIAVLSGCSTYATNRYSISADNVVALKQYKASEIGVGQFTATKPNQTEIMCRGVGPIKTPDGESFEAFVRGALISEMKIAEILSEEGKNQITGNLDEIDFNSNSGIWTLSLTVNSSNGKQLKVNENYKYSTSFYGETACNQTAQALMPAVQNLISKLVQNKEFASMLN